MNCNWKEFRLGDLTTWSSGSTPSKQNRSFWGGEIPWISGTVMRSKNLSESDLYLTQEGLENKGKLCEKDSILLLVRGDLFKRIPIGIATKSLCFNQDIKAINSISNNLLQHFIYYLLEGNKKKLSNMVEFTGLGAGKLDTKLLQDLTFKIPPIHYQKNLINFIDSIDSKIELNRQSNQNLEEIAKALFKSWFIDFDPVRAKADGRSTGLPSEISDLFPDSFEVSELGQIPKGWEIINLDKITSKFTTGLNPRKNFVLGNGDNFYVTIKNLGDLQVLLDQKCDKVDDEAI
ncbi:restriction endonuclease subunit S, partial [Prochlorococcus sp. AH-736-J10]|nr:restriction endonuclease subunit S [Prochlorococcus sp. AH-736-J10]